MCKVIIVRPMGSGKYIAKTEDQKSLTVWEMDSEIVKDCSANSEDIAAQIANHYCNNVLNWNKQNNKILVQGQLANNDFVFIQHKVSDNHCYSD